MDMSNIKIFVTHTPNKNDYMVDNPLLVDVIAGADYQTKPENCAISSLYFYADDTKNPEVKLPGGITIKSTSDDLKKWAGDKFDYSKSGDSEYYDYYDDDNEGYIDINCKKTVSSMSVKKETWPSK